MRQALARVLPLFALLLLLTPTQPVAQTDVEVGAGRDVNEAVAPDLSARTPAAEPIEPSEVPLFVPHEDQLIGRVTIPDEKLATLVQPEGRLWRTFRVQGVYWIAAAVILLSVAGLAGFYLWRGTIRIERGRSGRWVPRFGSFERFAHWTTAVSFIVLALTGLVVTFGRHLLIPLLGHYTYSPVAEVSKTLHNWSAGPFVLGILLLLITWARDNLPTREDWVWLREGGGMFKKHSSFHPETERFNAGQKIIYWSVVLGGIVLAVTGYLLMTPFFFTGVSGMQVAHVIHALTAILLIAVILGHIYIGTIGMEGAFDAIGRGEVDENWAIEHHRGWYNAQVRQGRGAPADGERTMPAE